MHSDLDKAVEPHPGQKDDDPGHRVTGLNAHGYKQQELAATALARDGVYDQYAHVERRGDYRNVVDLKLTGLPASANASDLKHIAGVKHVIDATTVDDTITNSCTGQGEIKCRLGEGETKEQLI